MAAGSKKVIYAALVGNGLIAITKFAAAVYTGSSAMLSEGIHSVVDTGNQILLLLGIRRATRPPDPVFPLGHGKEIYFWSFVVSTSIFAVGAGVSLYEGVRHVLHPREITNPAVNYVVLSLALIFEGGAWWFAWKEFKRVRGKRGHEWRLSAAGTVLALVAATDGAVGLVVMLYMSLAAPRAEFLDVHRYGLRTSVFDLAVICLGRMAVVLALGRLAPRLRAAALAPLYLLSLGGRHEVRGDSAGGGADLVAHGVDVLDGGVHFLQDLERIRVLSGHGRDDEADAEQEHGESLQSLQSKQR